MIEKIEIAYA